jgi:CDP-6-deoxy-D-xylo-4-hexulose-3-dehydrase
VQETSVTDSIYENVRRYFSSQVNEFIPGKSKISLQVPAFGADEVNEAIESLLSTWVTMGKKVRTFEELFADYIGTKYAVMLNSGSSANLVALSVLTNAKFSGCIPSGSEVITPAVTWVTTVYPISNVNLIPTLVDVDMESFNINVDSIKKAITNKTRAIMPVHLLGNPANIEEIMEIAEKYNLFVLEDTCESHGAEVNGKKAGSFGDISTFSFFLSHHITTIEGGMLLTDDDEIYEMAKAMRAFGWIRDLSDKDSIAERFPDLDRRFLFTNMGYNFRPTEIQGAFGIHQIKKLEAFIKIRQDNANYWNKRLEKYSDYLLLHKQKPKTRHVSFAYPITVKSGAPFTKAELVQHLEKHLVETRPIEASDITEQPVMEIFKHRIAGSLVNSKVIHKNSFFIGNHQGIGIKEREYVANVIEDFIAKKGRA